MNRLIWRDMSDFAKNFCNALGLDIKSNFNEIYCQGSNETENDWQLSWMRVESRATSIISENWSGSDPSPFKQVAATALSIVEMAPIPEYIDDTNHDPLKSTPRILSSAIAYFYAKAFLEGAKIGEYQTEKIINEPLKPSSHFLTDFLIALALSAKDQEQYGVEPKELERVSNSFNYTTLIFESLAYGANGWPLQ